MFHLEDVLQMKDGEVIHEIVRRHWLMLVPGLFVAFLLIVVPFFFLFPLFQVGMIGVIIFSIALLSGILIALRLFILWDANVLIVSSLRLVDVNQRGLFTRIVSETALSSIKNSTWIRKGIFETIFNIGTLQIETSSISGPFEVTSIARPERLNERLNDLRHHTQPEKNDHVPERQKALKKIAQLLETYSVEELSRIETILLARERSVAVDTFLAEDKSVKS